MQQKMLVVGVVAAVACLWLILSWEPVAREEPLDNTFSQPEPAAAPETVSPPAAAARPEQPAQPPAPEPEPEPDPEPGTNPPTPTEPLFKLEQAVPEKLDDMAHLPPPSASGPLTELQKEFESSARDTDSARVEGLIADAFKMEQVPPGLLESAVCQGGICRVRTRWTPERAGGFMMAVTTIAVKVPGDGQDTLMFDRNIAVGPASDRNSNGERSIDVYLRKRNKK